MYSVCELSTGALLSSNRPIKQRRLVAFVQHLTVLHPEVAVPTVYAEAAAAHLSAGTTIRVMGRLIGIITKTYGLPFLTRDTKHFHRIPGLPVACYGTDDP